MGGGSNHYPLLENRHFFGTKCPIDLRPVFLFKFVCCALSVRFDPSRLSKLKNIAVIDSLGNSTSFFAALVLCFIKIEYFRIWPHKLKITSKIKITSNVKRTQKIKKSKKIKKIQKFKTNPKIMMSPKRKITSELKMTQ